MTLVFQRSTSENPIVTCILVYERLGENVGFEENALRRKTDLKFQGEWGWVWVGWGVSVNFREVSENFLGNFLKITGWSDN